LHAGRVHHMSLDPMLWTLKQVTLRGSPRSRLDSISLEIAAGVTAIVGESGAGKSSLLGLLAGLDRPDSGQVTCHIQLGGDRLPLFWLPPGNGLWSPLTVREHLQLVAPAEKRTAAQIESRLCSFDLLELAGVRPDELSQGEQARLAVARALASEAQVLLLDEPLVHTSITKNETYWRVVRETCRQLKTSLVIATHDLSAIRREADRVVILDQGRVVYDGDLRAGDDLKEGVAKDLLERIRLA
jgi:iron(III) transport system ATP-binding protein